jgi:hypothetical protein
MAAAGVSDEEIAARLGHSSLVIAKIRSRWDIPAARSRSIANRDNAREQPRKRIRKRRSCITCGTPFLSHGPHHRMCDSCRHLELSPFAP